MTPWCAEVDLGAVAAGSRLNNLAALHRRDVKPRRQRPVTQYQPSTQTDIDDLFMVCSSEFVCK